MSFWESWLVLVQFLGLSLQAVRLFKTSWRQRLVPSNPSIGSLWTALTRLKMVVVKHSWFKLGQTGDSLSLQVPQLGWFLCSWTVLFERFQQTVSSSLFLWYWIFVVSCGGAFLPRISGIQEMKWNTPVSWPTRSVFNQHSCRLCFTS